MELKIQIRKKILKFYGTSSNSLDTYDITNFQTILNNPNFDVNKPTTFYFHGSMEFNLIPSVSVIKDAYVANGRHNFIIVGNKFPFLYILRNTPIISEKLSDNLLEFVSAGYDIKKIIFLSYSLGSKAIAPMTSRLIKLKSNSELSIPRIVALDPGIMKDHELKMSGGERLNSNDADFVMTVHTDCRYWGTKDPHGHVNFWINGGCDQPICTNDLSEY